MATKRELELELAVWQERTNATRNAAAAIQAQGQLLQMQDREARDNIARLTAELKAIEEQEGETKPTPAPVAIVPQALEAQAA